jgi:peptidyl-tRNA hydrolase
MKTVQYIFINAGLAMSIAKTAAMAAHAAVGSYRKSLTFGFALVGWERTGEMTVILEARDENTCETSRTTSRTRVSHRSHH